MRGNSHGELRRGVEGLKQERDRLNQAIQIRRQVSWTGSHRYTKKTEEAETGALGSSARHASIGAEQLRGLYVRGMSSGNYPDQAVRAACPLVPAFRFAL